MSPIGRGISIMALSVTACARATPSQVPPSPTGAQQTAGPEETAQRSAEEWLRLVDQGEYEASWDSASVSFRGAVTKQQWRDAVAQARGPLEPFGARRLTSRQYATSLPNAPPGQYVVLQYETVVGGGQRVVETVVPMRDADGRWRVSGYFVRPQ
jgi:hypothetical protein